MPTAPTPAPVVRSSAARRGVLAVLASGVIAAALAACSDPIAEMSLTPDERTRVLALQNPFGEGRLARLPGAGGEVLIGVGEGCKAYRAVQEQGVVTGWQRIDALPSANVLSGGSCSVKKLALDGPYLRFQYCAQAIGAGGGCGGGSGDFRSQDGRHWEAHTERQGWQPVGP